MTLEQRKKIIAEAADQRYVEFTGGETKYTSGTVHELNKNSQPIEREFYDFYRTPRGEYTPKGQSPKLTTHPTLTSNVKFMNFYPLADIETISPRPMLFIAGENAHSIEFSEEVYRLAGEPKELVIVPGTGHVDSCVSACSSFACFPDEPRKIRGLSMHSSKRQIGAAC